MGCTGLQRFFILHHGFDTVGMFCACKLFGVAFFTGNYRKRKIFFGKFFINFQNLEGFFFRFFGGGMRGVPFLP